MADRGVSWWLPDNLIDKKNFIAVGSMHNFSYLGGLIGLLAGIIYILRKKNKIKEEGHTSVISCSDSLGYLKNC